MTSLPMDEALFLGTELQIPVFPCYSAIGDACSCRLGKRCRTPGKHPATRRGFKDASCDTRQIRQWWGKQPERSLGVATGNGLIVIDVDFRNGGEDSLRELESELGPLPRDWVVVTGGGGLHIYLSTHPGAQFHSLSNWRPGIDIKANGGYVIAPPSRHASGELYQWLAPRHLPATIPAVPKAWLEQLPPDQKRKRANRPSAGSQPAQRRRARTHRFNNYKTICPRLPVSAKAQDGAARILECCVLTGKSQTNDRITALARDLKTIAEIAEFRAEQLKPLIKEWHRVSRRHMSQPDWGGIWTRWKYTWDKWAKPGSSTLHSAYERSLLAPLPPEAFGYVDPKQRELLAFCRELQASCAAADGTFFLSCRKAAAVVGIGTTGSGKNVANAWLNKFVDDGLLEKVGGPDLKNRKAQKYRYLGQQCRKAA